MKNPPKQPLAFPVPHAIDGNWNEDPHEEYRGMNLRDYFAAKSLVLFSSAQAGDLIDKLAKKGGMKTEALISAMAYKVSDAMMEARKCS